MKTLLLFFLPPLLAVLPCRSQAPRLTPDQKRAVIDSMISVWHAHGYFNGGILISQKGNIIYQRSAGYSDFENGTLHTGTTRFNLASISKPFTAIAVLQLAGRKKLALTDTFARYFPGFPYPDVTITQLLSHTSGLPEADQYEKPYIAAHPSEILSSQQLYDDLIKLKTPAPAKAGEKYFYNNLNYVLLALLVEKISRMPFPVYMQKNIFEKAGMKNSFIRERISPNTARYFRPTFYDTAFRHVDSISDRKIYTDYPLGGTYGDNNVITTLQDMFLFDKALNSGRLLPPALLKIMYQPVKLADGTYFFTGGKKTYTLGWEMNEKNSAGQFVVWHGGSLVGLTTLLFKNLTGDITYIFYENRATPNTLRRFLAISNVIDNLEPMGVPLQQSLVREYGAALVGNGPHAAAVRLNALKNDTAWYFNDVEMNELGRELQRASKPALAMEVFRLNALLSPQSPVACRSYADALLALGLKAEAAAMYRKTLKLSPGDENAQNGLKKAAGTN